MSQYRKQTIYQAPRLPRSGNKEVDAIADALEKHLGDFSGKLNKEFKHLEETSTGSSNTIINNNISGGGGSGGGGGSSTKEVIVKEVSLTSGSPFSVTFDALSNLFWFPTCYATQDGMGTVVGYKITWSTSGFTITPDADCYCKYAYQHIV